VIESAEFTLHMAHAIKEIADRVGLGFVFKSSFDKANRTSLGGYRGTGMDSGLAVLQRVRDEVGVPVVTDIHESWQAAPVAEVVDLLQIPAFLCRQTDLLLAAADTGKPVNVKKAQFLAPGDMKHVATKLKAGGAVGVLLTERGTSFGYHELVVDFRSLPQLRDLGYPVVFDATHSVQRPGARDGASGGDRRFVPPLARAAVAVGVDALFMEIHEDPDSAPSDGPNMIRLDELEGLLVASKQIAGFA
jgi:2-dehydro-3-deoxyphosphooctonate aldolase (KDO 8-P synthase)